MKRFMCIVLACLMLSPITAYSKKVETAMDLTKFIASLPKPTTTTFIQEDDGIIYRELLGSGSGEYINYNHATGSIFPGAVIRGDSLFTDDYIIIGRDRAPVELSLGANIETVDSPTQPNVTSAIHKLIDSGSGNYAANMRYYEQTVARGKTFSTGLNAGVGFSGIGANISSGTTSSMEQYSTNILVVLTQTFYTVHAAWPEGADGFFMKNADHSMFKEITPAYISSVSYGRMGIMTISSNYSESEVKSALDAAVPLAGGAANASSSISSESKKIFNESSIAVQIVGGEASASGSAVNWEGFFNFFVDAESSFNARNAVPLSYTLRYLKDNTVVPAYTILNEHRLSSDAMVMDIELTNITTFNNNADVKSNTQTYIQFKDMEALPFINEVIRTEDDTNILANHNKYIIDNYNDSSEMLIQVDRQFYGGLLEDAPKKYAQNYKFTDLKTGTINLVDMDTRKVILFDVDRSIDMEYKIKLSPLNTQLDNFK